MKLDWKTCLNMNHKFAVKPQLLMCNSSLEGAN